MKSFVSWLAGFSKSFTDFIGILPKALSFTSPIARGERVLQSRLRMKGRHETADRLAIIRAYDHFRYWTTLEDKRVCLLCDRTFDGNEVGITAEGDECKLRCPTPECPSEPHQWVYTGNPLVSDKAYADWWRALAHQGGPGLEVA